MRRRTTHERSRGTYPAPGLFVTLLTILAIELAALAWFYVTLVWSAV